MSRIILMAIMLSVTVAGCNRFPDLTIQVTANLQPSAAPNCSVTADQEEVVFRGRYDLAVEGPYIMAPRIESYIVDASLDTQATQGNIQITSFNLTIKLPDNTVPELPGGLPNPYQVSTSAVIPPSPDPGGVSLGVAAAPVIPASYQSALAAIASQSGFDSIVLDVRANGTTSGGFNQQSGPFSWPIELCTGCLAVAECDEDTEPTCLPGQDADTYCISFAPPAT